VFPDWQPSARVQALTTKQIEETRRRLNVVVEDNPEAATTAPIEAFDDMVRLGGFAPRQYQKNARGTLVTTATAWLPGLRRSWFATA
jgi:hypothetical protein